MSRFLNFIPPLWACHRPDINELPRISSESIQQKASPMGRPHDVAKLVREGKSFDEIAAELGISEKSVEQYAHRAIGEGLLRESDVYNSPEALLGDLYEDLRRIEIRVHSRIHRALVQCYGDGESNWWRKGMPERIRVKCHERRERDIDEPCEPFCYCDLLDLDAILEDQWTNLNDLFPDYTSNRTQLSKDLRQLNGIRNKVMHPLRGLVPGEDEFAFVLKVKSSFGC